MIVRLTAGPRNLGGIVVPVERDAADRCHEKINQRCATSGI